MSSDRWDRIETLFAEALEVPDDQRWAYLEKACGDDHELRSEVERLLAGDTKAGAELLESGYPAELIQDTVAHQRSIGPYRILGLLGEGGMGQVYLAEQTEPVQRRVALKLIKLGMDTRETLKRFEAERQTLAKMEHDSIAKVFDAGIAESGQSYFVMEHVAGVPLTEYCDAHELSTRERLELFTQVCEGVQHAHQKGIIHRDLKPSNILVSEQRGRAVPKIIDFGIAKATDQDVAGTLFTEQGRVIGTPEYMSPEQAAMSSADLDTRSDVYALGVILYELLTGELPFSRDELRAAGLGEIQRKIREDEPPKPSTRIARTGTGPDQVARQHGTSAAALVRELRGDLDWIVMRALEKERDRRYATPIGLAEDILRHLHHEPVDAGPPGTAYRLRKFVRRYRLQVSAACALVVVLIGGIVGTSVGMVHAGEQARIAGQRADEITRQNEEIQASAAALRTRTDEFDMLSSVVHLATARNAESELYPPWPENQDEMRAWLDENAHQLQAALPRLRATVAQLAERNLENQSDRFLHDTLQEAVNEIEAFEPVIEGVAQRLRWAERVADLTTDHPNAHVPWDTAREAVRSADGITASQRYRSDPAFELPVQAGLVPIGMNPVTLLWEFYHLRSAWDPASGTDPADLEIPTHHPETGHIEVGDDTGIVFVLVPGASYAMGSQSDDPDGPNYDPRAVRGELPVHDIALDPYFIARHEMTQGQWMHLTGGENPSIRVLGTSSFVHSFTHPVEGVDWEMSRELLTQNGLRLPTEAQWETACRGGTDTPWWTGDDRDTLIGAANLADQTAKRAGAPWISLQDWPELEDGFVMHAPVDALRPNGFGLHHVHGNVSEWCEDLMGDYILPHRDGDGLRTHLPGENGHANRGGHYMDMSGDIRSARRGVRDPTIRTSYVGVRAARSVIR